MVVADLEGWVNFAAKKTGEASLSPNEVLWERLLAGHPTGKVSLYRPTADKWAGSTCGGPGAAVASLGISRTIGCLGRPQRQVCLRGLHA
jgi:hypothetical protein